MRTLLSLTAVIFSLTIYGQVPQAFKYQAVARDATGDLLVNQQISVRITIIDSAAGGTSVYSEIHKEGTNQFGLFSINVGEGITSDVFSNIQWSTGNKWIKIELDPTGGNNHTPMGTHQLLSVPYALFAVNGGSGSDNQQLSLNGTDLSIDNGNTISLSAFENNLSILATKTTTTSGATTHHTFTTTSGQINDNDIVEFNYSGEVADNNSSPKSLTLTVSDGSTTLTIGTVEFYIGNRLATYSTPVIIEGYCIFTNAATICSLKSLSNSQKGGNMDLNSTSSADDDEPVHLSSLVDTSLDLTQPLTFTLTGTGNGGLDVFGGYVKHIKQ